jgi:hypothetical protein
MSTNVLIPVVFLVLGLGFTGLAGWAGVRYARLAREQAQRLADALGLTLAPAQPTLGLFWPSPRGAGTMRGKYVEFFNYTTGSGKSSTTWSALTVRPRADGGLTFRLRKQGMRTKVMELFGAKEITVDDATFDAAWFVQTNQPDYFRAALVGEIRDQLMAARRAGANGSFQLEGAVVKYAEQGTFGDDRRRQRYELIAPLLCDLADVAEVFAQERP